jgi:LysR family transcriptional regulator, transcriptional activator of the cysJI operon
MTLHQLRIFECVGTLLNITKASEILHISQPSVSQQLKLLEEEFDTKFFARLSQGVELTHEGKEFFDAVKPILTQADLVEKRFKRSSGFNQAALLKVGGSNNVSVDVLPKLLMTFKQSHPLVQFILETNDSSVMEKRLLNAEVDIGLITNPSYRAEIVYEPYEEMQVVAFCLPISPVAGKTLTLRELGQLPLVVRTGGRIEQALRSQRDRMNITVRCEASAAVKAAVGLGMGVGVLYRNAIASRIASGSLKLINVPELKEMGVQSFIIFDKRKPLSPIAKEFLEMMMGKRETSAFQSHNRSVQNGVGLSLR